MVAHEHGGARTDSAEVDELAVERVGVDHAEPEAVLAAGFAGDAVVEFPVANAAGIAPAVPVAVERIVPIGLLRQVPAKVGAAVGAIADALPAGAGPTVVGKAFDVVARNDLAHDVEQILVVIRPIHAGHEAVLGLERLALAVGRHPVRMGIGEFTGDAVGIHAGKDDQANRAGGRDDVAEEIAVIEVLGLVLERELGGVVGDDAAGVDDDALHARAAPVIEPEGEVVSGRVDLGDVGLAPAEGAAIPRLSHVLIVTGADGVCHFSPATIIFEPAT